MHTLRVMADFARTLLQWAALLVFVAAAVTLAYAQSVISGAIALPAVAGSHVLRIEARGPGGATPLTAISSNAL